MKIITLLLLLVSTISFGQMNPGARQVALAHSDITTGKDVFTLFTNPAGLSLINERQVGFYYSPAPFGVKDMANAFAAFVEPTQYGAFSIGFSTYGFELYKETRLALSYSNKINNTFYAGGSIYYSNTSIKNYGNSGAIIVNVGAIARISKEINFGAAIQNLTRSTIGDESNQIPTIMWVGGDFNFVEDFTFTAGLEKEIGFNPSIRLGAEYNLLDYLALRIGSANEPNIYAGGVGIFYNIFELDYAVSNHPDLGLTHQFALIIRFAKE